MDWNGDGWDDGAEFFDYVWASRRWKGTRENFDRIWDVVHHYVDGPEKGVLLGMLFWGDVTVFDERSVGAQMHARGDYLNPFVGGIYNPRNTGSPFFKPEFRPGTINLGAQNLMRAWGPPRNNYIQLACALSHEAMHRMTDMRNAGPTNPVELRADERRTYSSQPRMCWPS